MKPGLRVMLEWRSWPLWTVDEDGGEDTPDPRELAGTELGAELVRWGEDHDALWDPDDPGAGPRFADRAAETAFFARGRALAERLAAEVGDRWSVRFLDGDGRWVELS